MRNETKLPELVSVASATPVCNALYTSLLGIETIDAPAACHIAAKVGLADAAFLGSNGAGKPCVGEDHDAGLVDLRLDVLHERRVVEALRTLVVAHQAGH